MEIYKNIKIYKNKNFYTENIPIKSTKLIPRCSSSHQETKWHQDEKITPSRKF